MTPTALPDDFLFGAASAAYQVEGAWNADGKGPSVWDAFAKIPGKTFRGSHGDVAVDQSTSCAHRIAYLRAHLQQCRLAIDDGVRLAGFCVWSFTDLLSWLNGYQKRYGLVYVRRTEAEDLDLACVPKKS